MTILLISVDRQGPPHNHLLDTSYCLFSRVLCQILCPKDQYQQLQMAMLIFVFCQQGIHFMNGNSLSNVLCNAHLNSGKLKSTLSAGAVWVKGKGSSSRRCPKTDMSDGGIPAMDIPATTVKLSLVVARTALVQDAWIILWCRFRLIQVFSPM